MAVLYKNDCLINITYYYKVINKKMYFILILFLI